MHGISEVMVILGGVFFLGFAVFHLLFWRLFHWKRDLGRLLPVNKAIMQVLNLCLALVFLVMAVLCFFFTNDLVATRLGKALLAGVALFWGLRTIEQPVFFGFKSAASKAITGVFVLGTVIFVLAAAL